MTMHERVNHSGEYGPGMHLARHYILKIGAWTAVSVEKFTENPSHARHKSKSCKNRE
jgi:hypothetical protein